MKIELKEISIRELTDNYQDHAENGVACCKYCNTAKNTMSVDEFLKWIGRVYEFNNLDSTGVACLNTNRKFLGIEMDANYYEIACDRLNNKKY